MHDFRVSVEEDLLRALQHSCLGQAPQLGLREAVETLQGRAEDLPPHVQHDEVVRRVHSAQGAARAPEGEVVQREAKGLRLQDEGTGVCPLQLNGG